MRIEKRNSLSIIINSTAFYLLSYLFVFMLFQLTTIIASNIFDIPNTLYYNKIGFNVIPDAWTPDSVKVIYTSGNILLFLISISFLVIIIKSLEFNGLLRLFFIWGFVHSISMLFGSIVIGAFNFEGFGIVLSYLYLADTAKMLLLFTGLLILVGIGMGMVKVFLFSANSYFNYLSPEMRPAFRRDQFVLPFLISTLLLVIIKYPLSLYETLILFIPMFMLLPLFWGIRRYPVFYFEETTKSIKISTWLIVITLGVYLLYRVVLGIGINIG
ncbi:MAG: hypothetical protein WC780_10080 [Lentimicrobiaceae bacterium]